MQYEEKGLSIAYTSGREFCLSFLLLFCHNELLVVWIGTTCRVDALSESLESADVNERKQREVWVT